MVIFLTANMTQNKMFTIRLRLFYKVEEPVTKYLWLLGLSYGKSKMPLFCTVGFRIMTVEF